MDVLTLPCPVDALPESVRRFVATDAPGPARMMAARGMVPLKGQDLLTVLIQLAHGEDAQVAQAARDTLTKMPEAVLVGSVSALELPAILHGLAELFEGNDAVLEPIVLNARVASETVALVARRCREHLTEVIAVNQQRILGHPAILEALYKNRHARMSTIDRLVELAARNGVEVEGIPAFKFHAEAIAGQLIPEPEEGEILPSDQMFAEAIAADSSDGDVMDVEEDGDANDEDARREKLKDKFKPLAFRIRDMTTSEKIRFAIVGDAAARALLVRDPKKVVYYAAITSPAMTETEATAIAHSKEVAVDVLRYIGNRKEWLKSYDIKRVLMFNPKTPIDVSMRFLSHLRANDLKTLSQSRGIPSQLKILARQRLEMAEKKG